jgi:alkylation response protein AidB-like acyl-CoA dehydrogenase
VQLALTADEAAFRDKLREFYTTEIPSEIRARVRAGEGFHPDDLVGSQRILNANRLAVPNWPVEWGGQDWTPTQHQIWLDEMQLACVPEPLNFNTKMVGPVIAEFGSQELKERFLPPTANCRSWRTVCTLVRVRPACAGQPVSDVQAVSPRSGLCAHLLGQSSGH